MLGQFSMLTAQQFPQIMNFYCNLQINVTVTYIKERNMHLKETIHITQASNTMDCPKGVCLVRIVSFIKFSIW